MVNPAAEENASKFNEPVIWESSPSREPPLKDSGPVKWVRTNLFDGWFNTAITLVLAWVLITAVPQIWDWAVTHSYWGAEDLTVAETYDLCRVSESAGCQSMLDARPDLSPSDLSGVCPIEATQTCLQSTKSIAAKTEPLDYQDWASVCRNETIGACWAVLNDKMRFIMFGLYPFDQHWRPFLAMILLVGTVVLAAARPTQKWIWFGAFPATAIAIGILMGGGVGGLSEVPIKNWGGLPLTLGLSVVGLLVAFPLGILLALGRQSHMPFIKSFSVFYIELIRGVPLITLLFMASFLLPLFLPDGFSINTLLRAQVAFILFAAAYLAEVVRGGLQAIPKGQYEAADSMGLSYWQKMRLIILPQALKVSIPPIVNTFIGFFKDTSLVVVISLYDLLGTAKVATSSTPVWRDFYFEVYAFLAVVYFLFCYAMSVYSRHLERKLHTGYAR
ncbi:MAG: hypothetical protein Alpg2KO_33000 [Alphaproteobacteria bacterium]